MRNNRKWVMILCGFLAALMLFGLVAGILPYYVGAARSTGEISSDINALKKKKSGIDEQIEALESKISANMGKMEEIVTQKNLIDQEIFLLHEKTNNVNDQITAYGTLIADKQAELSEAQKKLDALNEKYKQRIQSMEEDGKLSYWSVIFKASNFSDLLDRLNMVEEIAEADQRRLQELDDLAKTVATAKAELVTQKAALEESKKELEETQKSLEAKRAESDAMLSALNEKGMEFQSLLDQEEDKLSEMEKSLTKLESEYDEAKEREYQQWLAQNPPKQENKGGTATNVDGITWLTPINYDFVSSPFGYRIHPITGVWKFHYGVDLSAAQGTPIVASRSGKVTVTDYEAGGAGYYVSINHFDGFATRYMHMTHYIVSPGQYVSAGQVIGYCGSTGASTGPHLHFSVYYNGTAVNPALYINI